MTADPFDERCRNCHTPLLAAPETADEQWCPDCAHTRPRPRRRLAGRIVDWLTAEDHPSDTPLDDPLAWSVNLRDVAVHHQPVVRDWLALHGIQLRRIADEPGVIDVYAGPDGAYLHVVLDPGGDHTTPLVMTPPALPAAADFRRLRRTDIAEGTTAMYVMDQRRPPNARDHTRPRALPPPQNEGTLVKSHPRRAAIASWCRHRPHLVGAATLLLICTYLAGISYMYWSGPWISLKTAVVILAGLAVIRTTGTAVRWSRRWQDRQP